MIGLCIGLLGAPSIFAAKKSLKAGYEDGWKWYQYRKSQGAPDSELADILRTMLKKYGKTKLDLTRVRKALKEHQGGSPAPSKPKAPPTSSKKKKGAPEPPVEDRWMGERPSKKPAKTSEKKSKDPAQTPKYKKMVQDRLKDLSSPNEDVRISAARDLGNLKARDALEPLSDLLDDKSSSVAMVAKHALVKIGPESLPYFLEVLSNRNADARLVACVGLGDLGSQDALAALQRAAKDKDERVRLAAFTAIDKIQNTEPAR